MSGIDVFSGAIKYLKESFLKNIETQNNQNDITVDEVRWVLTVPALWHNSSKQFMREAAEKVKCHFLPLNICKGYL